MPKPIKPENVISPEDKNAIEQGTSTISQVSKDKNIPYQSVYNQVKKGKLAVTFEKGSEQNIQNTSLPDFKEPEPTKIIDYTASVSNFWSFVDMIFRFICPLFRLEYIGMDKQTIDDLTEKTKEKLGSFITGHSYVDWLGTIGVIGYTFVTRIKIKPKEDKKKADESSTVTTLGAKVVSVEPSSQMVEPPKDKDYKHTPDGLVKSDLSIDEIKKAIGV